MQCICNYCEKQKIGGESENVNCTKRICGGNEEMVIKLTKIRNGGNAKMAAKKAGQPNVNAKAKIRAISSAERKYPLAAAAWRRKSKKHQ